MSAERVEDDELLYRRVELRGQGYSLRPYGASKISSQAFADREQQPSVDRARLCGGPAYTQGDEQNGVLRLVTGQVREINSVQQTDQKGNVEFRYKFDVVPVPLEENPAHAEIHAAPAYRNKQRFRRLLEQLSLLAEWEVYPADLR